MQLGLHGRSCEFSRKHCLVRPVSKRRLSASGNAGSFSIPSIQHNLRHIVDPQPVFVAHLTTFQLSSQTHLKVMSDLYFEHNWGLTFDFDFVIQNVREGKQALPSDMGGIKESVRFGTQILIKWIWGEYMKIESCFWETRVVFVFLLYFQMNLGHSAVLSELFYRSWWLPILMCQNTS